VKWGVLLGAGAITIGFSYLFGTKNTSAQVLMTAGPPILVLQGLEGKAREIVDLHVNRTDTCIAATEAACWAMSAIGT